MVLEMVMAMPAVTGKAPDLLLGLEPASVFIYPMAAVLLKAVVLDAVGLMVPAILRVAVLAAAMAGWAGCSNDSRRVRM